MKTIKNDLFAGVTAAVVALPLALAFGVASGAGAMAGVYGAIVLGFFASLFGGTNTQISGPTGPMTVIMASAVVIFAGDLSAVMTVVLIAGLLQILFGVIGIGKWIKFIPYPVISGFMSGIGVIIIVLQINPFLGVESSGSILQTIIDVPNSFQHANYHSLMIAFITLCIMFFTPKRISKIVPPALIALLLMSYMSSFFYFNVPTIGEIPTALPSFAFPTTFEFIKLKEIVTLAVTLALLGAIDTLLTSVVADSLTKTKHNSNKELIGQGIGNTLCSFIGAVPGAGATMRTVINIKSGGTTKLSGMVHAITLLIIVLFLAPFASQIPLAVLAGILIKVGFDILDYRFIKIITKIPRKDLLIMSIVLILTVFVDLIMAVGAGITIASILSIYHISKETKFKIKRNKLIFDIDINNKQTKILKVEGSLFFATSAILEKKINKFFKSKNIIIDCHDVGFMDISAMFSLEEIIVRFKEQEINTYLILSENNRRKILKIDTNNVFKNLHIFRHIEESINFIQNTELKSDIYLLNDMHIDGVKNIPLLGISFLPKQINVLEYDALVFTSKNAAYALDSFNGEWKSVPCFVIAPKTAKVIEELGGNIAYIGNSGHGNEFALELTDVLKGKKVLYLRAKKVVSKLVPLLKQSGIDIDEAIIYETACNKVENPEVPKKDSVIIFSSPSTIECFFENFSWDSSYKAVVIGQTTAQYLPKHVPYVVSKSTSIEECIALAKEEAMVVNNGK